MSVSAAPLRPAHVVIVVEEDRFANAIGDTTDFPYVNQLAAGGLLFSDQQGLNTSEQSGEMNYLALYSGSTQGVTDDGQQYTFSGPNIAQSLNSTAGLSFASFAESLPSDGSQVDEAAEVGGFDIPDLYTRCYNPAAMFTKVGPGLTNADVNRTFSDFQKIAASPGGYADLPTVSLVIPNNLDNTHGSQGPVAWAGDPYYYDFFRKSADAWLKTNISPYVQWARAHNSLLIVLGDEGDRNHDFAKGTQAIIAGDPRLVVPGVDSTPMNVYNVLRTVEEMYGQAPLGKTATTPALATNALGQLAAPDTRPPSTPTLTSETATTVSIGWKPSTDNVAVAGYDIYRDGSLAGSVSGQTTSFNDTGLKPSTTYNYSVAAIDAAGNSSPRSGSLTISTSKAGTGLTATYYKTTTLSSPVKTRIDSTVDFNWGKSAPVAGANAERFSVEWVGQVQAQATETYTFYTTTTGGVRVWVNGKLLINDWSAHGTTTDKGTIALVGGRKYAIKVDYFDSGSSAACVLDWSTPKTAKSVIPTSALYY
jgi:acid phosphatase